MSASECPGLDQALVSARLSTRSVGEFSDRSGIVILIDGASLFQAAATLQIEIDYAKLLLCLANDRPILRASFYTGMSPGNQRQQAFLLWMQNHGYQVVSKALTIAPDGSRKADLSVEIAIDLLIQAEQRDTIVLVSNDANLTYAVAMATRYGCQVELVALRSRVSDSLLNLADRFVDLAWIQPQIQRNGEQRNGEQRNGEQRNGE